MPKKSAAARGSAQRQKQKNQKSFELVRPATPVEETVETTEEQIEAVEEQAEAVEKPTTTASAKSRRARRGASTTVAPVVETKEEEPRPEEVSAAPTRGSASARIAARRQATQRAQQRNAQSLLSPEHFAHVTRDLITIAVLAVVMLTIIIVLYFVIGRTA